MVKSSFAKLKNPTHTPRGVGGVGGVCVCIGVPARRRQKRFAHSTASRKEKKDGAYLPGVRRGAVREKGVNWGRWVSGSARSGGGHEGWWQGEHRAPWAMLVEGNGGLEEKEKKKIGGSPGRIRLQWPL